MGIATASHPIGVTTGLAADAIHGRRGAERTCYRVLCELRVLDGPLAGAGVFLATTRDYAETGVGIEVRRAVPVGKLVEIAFRTPAGDCVRKIGQVKRLRQMTANGFELGIRFARDSA